MNKSLQNTFRVFMLLQAVLYTFSVKAQDYGVVWTDMISMEASGSVLTKSNYAGSGWNSEALSSKALQPSEDGYFSYVVTDNVSKLTFLGFSYGANTTRAYSEMKYGFYLSAGALKYVVNGTPNSIGTYTTNDVLKVERTSTTVSYYQNGSLLHTETITAPTQGWYLSALMYYPNTSLTDVRISFTGDRFRESALPAISVDTAGLGCIDVTYSGGQSPYTYSWSNGANTEDICNVQQGCYTLTITDNKGDVHVKEYCVYEENPAIWTDLIGFIPIGTTLKKAGIGNMWENNEALSSKVLAPNEDGYMKYTITSMPSTVFAAFGFSYGPNTTLNWNEIKYGFYVSGAGALYRLVNQGLIFVDMYQVNDVLEIKRIGNEVVYYRNNLEIYRVSITSPSMDWYADVTSYVNNTIFDELTVSFSKDRFRETQMAVTSIDGSGLGSIDVSYSGGVLPYTYSWSNGATTEDISGVAPGFYTLTVTDNNGETHTKEYCVYEDYTIIWSDFIASDTIDTTFIYKPGGSQFMWNAEALSTRVLQPGEDGYLSHVVGTGETHPSALTIFGFSSGKSNSTTKEEIDFGFYIVSGTNLYSVVNGSTKGIDYLALGDLLEIRRNGNTVWLYKNGLELYEYTISTPSEDWYADVLLYNGNGSGMLEMRGSFTKKRFREESPAVTTVDAQGQGSIDVTYTGGFTPYMFSWSNGATTEDLTGVDPGFYTLTVVDSIQDTLVKEYHVLEELDVDWTDFNNTQVVGTTLYKASATVGWDAEAVSSQLLAPGTDGLVKYKAVETYAVKAFGFSKGANLVTTYSEIEYGFYVSTYRVLHAITNGLKGLQIDDYQVDDVLEVVRRGNTIEWYKNGRQIKSLPIATPTEDWYVDGLLYYNTKHLSNVKIATVPLAIEETTVDVVDGNLGSIDLAITGGIAPYQVHWLEDTYLTELQFQAAKDEQKDFLIEIGEDTIILDSIKYDSYKGQFNHASVTNVSPGKYPVFIYDNQGTRLEKEIIVNTNLIIAENVGLDITNNVISKLTGSDDWNTYMESANIVAYDDNAYLEIQIDNLVSNYAVGYKATDAVPVTTSYDDITYGFYVDNDQLSVVENGVITLVGTVSIGDKISIEKNQDNIIYAKNALQVQQGTGASTKSYYLKSNLNKAGTVINVISRIGKVFPVVNYATTNLECGEAATGAIDLTVTGRFSPFTYAWTTTNGSGLVPTAEDQTGLTPGDYTVTVTNSQGRTSTRTIWIGHKTLWIEKSNVECLPAPHQNSLQKNSPIMGMAKSNNILTNGLEGWTRYGYRDLNTTGNSDNVRMLFTDGSMTGRIIILDFLFSKKCIFKEYNGTNNVTVGTVWTLWDNPDFRLERNNLGQLNYVREAKIHPLTSFLNIPAYQQPGTTVFANDLFSRTMISNNPGAQVFDHISSFDCIAQDFSFDSHAKLKKKLDGGYHNVTPLGKLNFMFVEEYHDLDANLVYKVYNNENIVVTPTQTLTSIYGDNRYILDVSALTTGEFYTLEVENEKSEKWYVRFKR